MKSFSKKESLISITLIVLIFLLLNPFGMFMPSAVHMIVLALLVVVVGFFAGFVVNEVAIDERDQDHKNRAGRAGYIAGLGVILLGIVLQVLKHTPIDSWLLYALLAMVVVKIFSRVYSRRFR